MSPVERARRAAIYVALLLVGTATVLLAFGRSLWCSAGDLAPWSFETASVHNSQHILDPYSFTHFEHGILFFAGLWLLARRRPVGARMLATVTLEAAWEILENSSFIIDRYRAQTVDVGYYGDSVLNSMADIGWCALGFWFAARFRWWWSLGVMAVIETALAVAIRDNLLFNIITLIHPIDALVRWQRAR